MFGPCFVIICVLLVLQPSWLGKREMVAYFNCLPDVFWQSVFCGSSSRCPNGLVCNV